MWISIKNQFRFFIIFVILLPFITLGGLLLKTFHEEILSLKKKEQSLLIQSIKENSVDKQIQDIEKILKIYSKDERLARITEPGMQKMILQNEWSIVLSFFSKETEIYYASENGHYIISSNPLYNKKNIPAPSDWFSRAQKDQEIFWTDPYISEKKSELILSAVIPLFNKEKSFLGIVCFDIPLKEFFQKFKEESRYKDEKILAILNNHTVINFKRKFNEPIEYNNLYNWKELVKSHSVSREITIEDSDFYAFPYYIDHLDLYLISLVPVDQIKEEIRPFLKITTRILAGCFLLLYFVSFFFIRKIIDNIMNLNEYMGEITQGNYQLQNCIKGNDEFLTLNKRLNMMVGTLSQNIRQLQENNAQMTELVNLRTTMLHIISHNTSTPITILVNNSLELLNETPTREEFKQLYIASGNLKNLIENTMVYLKLEEGDLHINSEIINLADIAKQTYQMYEPLFLAKSLQIEFEAEESEWIGNYFLVKTIIENLIDNALKYSFPGGTVYIRCYQLNQYLVWQIQDCGPGIIEQDRSRLYKRFKKLSTNPTGGEKTTGLGLHLVKRLMNLFGGDILLEPYIPQKGAVFNLRFPVPHDYSL